MNEIEPLTPSARQLLDFESLRPDAVDLPEAVLFERISQSLQFVPLAATVSVFSAPAASVTAVKAGAFGKAVLASVLVVSGATVGAGSVYKTMSTRLTEAASDNERLRAELQSLQDSLEKQPKAKEGEVVPERPIQPPSSVTPQQQRAKPAVRAKEKDFAPPAVVVAGPAETDTLAAENVLLERARTALLRQNPSAALEALVLYGRAYPQGELEEEADAMRIQVLVQLERREEAVERAAAFSSKHPTSLLRESVKAAIDSLR